MKKKLMILVICIFSIFAFVSCGEEKDSQPVKVGFEKEMSYLTNPTKEIIENTPPESRHFLPIFAKLTYKINNIEEKGRKAVVNVTFNGLNMDLYMREYFDYMMNLEDFDKYSDDELREIAIKFFEDLVERKDLKYTDKTLDVAMKKSGDEWEVKDYKKLIEILAGNPYELAKSYDN